MADLRMIDRIKEVAATEQVASRQERKEGSRSKPDALQEDAYACPLRGPVGPQGHVGIRGRIEDQIPWSPKWTQLMRWKEEQYAK